MSKVVIHPTADVQAATIGDGTSIWQAVVVLPNARIGRDVNICAHCFIENEVLIGDRVTIKSGVYLWDGVQLGDDVFIGPNVTFTNDKFPRSKVYPNEFAKTTIEKGASIGGGAVLLPGLTVGRGAMVGAGAVVTKSVPPYAIVHGAPARIVGYVSNNNQSDISSSTKPDPTTNTVNTSVKGCTVHSLKVAQDMRGSLSVGEFSKDIPFKAKRYFLVYDVPSAETRGAHAHYECHQFLICVKGSCSVVADDGINRTEVVLDKPNKGVYLPPMVWGIQYKYSSDAVLLVFASHEYDNDDYIRDYDQFIKLVNANK